MVDTLLQSNRRTLDPSLSDGTPLGTFVLGQHALGPYSRVVVSEGFTQVLITFFYYGFADSDTLTASEVRSAYTTQTLPDVRQLYAAESRYSSSVQIVSDTDTLGAAETRAFYITSILTHTHRLDATETQAILVSQQYADTDTLGAAETLTMSSSGVMSDSLSLGATDAYAALVSIHPADEGTISLPVEGLSTLSEMSILLPQELRGGESLNIYETGRIQASDGQYLGLAEAFEVFTTLEGTDADVISATSQLSVVGFVSLSSSPVLSMTYTRHIAPTIYMTFSEEKKMSVIETLSILTQASLDQEEFIGIIYATHRPDFFNTSQSYDQSHVYAEEEHSVVTSVMNRSDSGQIKRTESGTFVVLTDYTPITFIKDIITEFVQPTLGVSNYDLEGNLPAVVREAGEDMNISQTNPENLPALVKSEPPLELGILREVQGEVTITQTPVEPYVSVEKLPTPQGIVMTTTEMPLTITIIHTFKGEL